MRHIPGMNLPEGFLDELRTRISLTQVVGRKVMWDQRKSNQARGDMWAPCPFHQEKTASFHVDDRKGFYYCFGCHAKGDAISFVRETENVDFLEAVRILAREAGMQLPEHDPQARRKADRRAQLIEVMEMAERHFQLALRTAAGAKARDYLARRGLREETRERFGIGFAPEGWQGLWEHLTARGVAPQMILDCGLARPSRKGGTPYDTFRNRIMFPIRDLRGCCIAFGGRAMDPDDNAKYLNSPETELFDKSRTLYNLGPAREAVGSGAPLIVAEGYMDVIALVEAGFEGAVAALGTALSEQHLQMLWRVADEPLVALDGDQAGLRAAWRLIDVALPLLEAGKSLRFALLPEGQDPDELLRCEGAGAMRALLEAALPMVELLWRRETEGRNLDSPERRAALDKSLREQIGRIRDPSIRHHYGLALRERRWQLFNPRSQGVPARRGRRGGWPAVVPVRAETKSSALVAAGDEARTRLREAVILATLIQTPAVLPEFEARIEDLPCSAPEHARLRDLLLAHAEAGSEALRDRIAADMGEEALDRLLRQPHVAVVPAVRRPGDLRLARQTVAEELDKLISERALRQEILEALEDIGEFSDEAVTYRLREAAQARQKAVRSVRDDQVEYEIGDNGAPVSRAEREAFEALLRSIGFRGGGEE